MASFMDRVVGAAKLDVRTYEEVEADTTATGQAMAVVVLSSVATGIGAPGILRVFGIIPLIGWIVMPVTGIWVLVTTVVAVRQALDYTSTLRAIGVCIVGWFVLVIWAIFMAGLIGGTAAVFG